MPALVAVLAASVLVRFSSPAEAALSRYAQELRRTPISDPQALPDALRRSNARGRPSRRFLQGRVQDPRTPEAAGALLRAREEHEALLAQPRAANLAAAWSPVGPAQVRSGDFGLVTGRVTALALDPRDLSGNTLYVGTTGGGVWKSTNAAGPSASVNFAPLTDTLPVFSLGADSSAEASLSVGALAMSPDGVLLAGTGDPNDATDSLYGEGILRSADGGVTWTLSQGSDDGVNGHHSFAGLSVSQIAWSTATPGLVVAALSSSFEGDLVNAPYARFSVRGLYVSADWGKTWQLATVSDGTNVLEDARASQVGDGGKAATAVVWNPVRRKFFAALRYHGYYESPDGASWTRMAAQPGAGLSLTACPTVASARGSCPIFRGALAVQLASGDLFALTVDPANGDQGLWQDLCGDTGGGCASSQVLFSTRLPSQALETGGGSSQIFQGDYNLALAAAAVGTDTVLYVGTEDLYRCHLAGGCVLRNTTNAANGCASPAGVAAAEHALVSSGSLVFAGTDGGLWRSTDGVAETGSVCNLSDSSHFDNLNGGLGSLAEVVSFAEDPVEGGTLLAGLGALGTAGTGQAGGAAWDQLATGEGGAVAIDPVTPSNWYLSTGAGVNIARCPKGSACEPADFAANVIGASDVSGDPSAVDVPWLLDPEAPAELLAGTCRVWRGLAAGGWTGSNVLSAPFFANRTTRCPAGSAVVRSLAAGGPQGAGAGGANVLYAGMAGSLTGGASVGGHLFATFAGDAATGSTVWNDAALGQVVNDPGNAGVFNPGGFDVSSIVVDAHDPSGLTVYATILGFSGNGISEPHVYRSTDGGGHWTNISSNLPSAPSSSLVVDPNDANTVYVALDTGVYVTTSVATCPAGNCWSVFGSGLPNSPVVQLAAAAAMPTGDGRKGELRAATYGRGIWETPLLTAIAPLAPSITLAPQALSFAATQVATESSAKDVTVTNSGTAPLLVTQVVTGGDFVAQDTCTGVAVAVQANCLVSVNFTPTGTGSRAGLLTVYGNVPGGQATVPLSGTGTAAAAITLTPLTMSFEATDVGGQSRVQNLAVSNQGGETTALRSVAAAGDFRVAANTCSSVLAAQTECTVSVVFAPTVDGTRTGTVTVIDDVGTQVASLVGQGSNPPTDALSVSALSFPPTELGATSAPQQVLLLNAGDEALTLVTASATGDFSVGNGCGATLAGRAQCAFSVRFHPSSTGSATGVLSVGDVLRTQTVSLNGSGLAPPGVSLSPGRPLDFGPVGVGLNGSTQTVTLTNNGGVPLAIYGASITGDFSIVGQTCGSALQPAGVCTFDLAFQPTGAGTRTGVLTITDAASSGSQRETLSGVGVDFTLAPDGPVNQKISNGQSATYLLLLNSAAGVPGEVIFTCAGVPAGATCAVSPVTTPLGAAGGSLITVTLATGQALSQVRKPPHTPSSFGEITVMALAAPLGLLTLRHRRRAFKAGGFGLLLLLLACSAGRTVPDSGVITLPPAAVTPSGTYTLVVAGSSTGLVRAVNLSVTVQ